MSSKFAQIFDTASRTDSCVSVKPESSIIRLFEVDENVLLITICEHGCLVLAEHDRDMIERIQNEDRGVIEAMMATAWS